MFSKRIHFSVIMWSTQVPLAHNIALSLLPRAVFFFVRVALARHTRSASGQLHFTPASRWSVAAPAAAEAAAAAAAMIRFFLLQNKQGKTRVSRWYVPVEFREKLQVENEVHRVIVNRNAKFTNFIEFKTCVVWRARALVRACVLLAFFFA